MTVDHRFIDTSGAVHEGKDVMKKGWREFFTKFPDYRNVFTDVRVRNGVVVMISYSNCSYNQLDGPSIWTARICNGLVSEWRVYEDTVSNRRKLGIVTQVQEARMHPIARIEPIFITLLCNIGLSHSGREMKKLAAG